MTKKHNPYIEKPAWLKCPICDTGFCYYLKKKNYFQCRKCGTKFRADWVKEECVGIPEAEL